MKLEMREHSLVVTKEPGDPRCSGIVNGKGESRLLYLIKKQLNAQGFDLIKKHCAKDGHLMDDLQQYLRTRKPSGNPEKDIYIYNSMWTIEGAEVELNKTGSVILTVVRDVFSGQRQLRRQPSSIDNKGVHYVRKCHSSRKAY
jgi:hypothetical protein